MTQDYEIGELIFGGGLSLLCEVFLHAQRNPTPENILFAKKIYEAAHKNMDYHPDELGCAVLEALHQLNLAKKYPGDEYEFWLHDYK